MRILFKHVFWAFMLLLAFSSVAYGQGARYDGMTFARSGLPAPGATIAVCNQPAVTSTQPCSVLATLFTDSTMSTPCSSVVPLPPNVPGSPCSNPMISDGLGNYHFYAQNGKYTLQFYGPGLTPIVQPDTTLPCDPTNCQVTISGNFARFQPVLGTALVSGDFTLTGWGTGATITGITGTDTSVRFTITAGTTPSINPTVKLTFHDGPWISITNISANWIGGTGSASDFSLANTLNDITATYLDLPVATKTYTVSMLTMGNSNVTVTYPPALNPVVLNPTGEQVINSFPLSTPSLDLPETASPGTPASSVLRIFSKPGDLLFFRNSAGVDVALSSAVSSVTISPPPDLFTASGPTTGAVNTTLTKVPQASSLVYASPCGSTGPPVFRALCAGDLSFFTYSGNTTKLATMSGSIIPGDIAVGDASGNLIDGGVASIVFTGTAAGCTISTGSSFDGCDVTINLNGTFPSLAFRVSCNGRGPNNGRATMQGENGRTLNSGPGGVSQVTCRTVNEGTALGVGFSTIEVIASYP